MDDWRFEINWQNIKLPENKFLHGEGYINLKDWKLTKTHRLIVILSLRKNATRYETQCWITKENMKDNFTLTPTWNRFK